MDAMSDLSALNLEAGSLVGGYTLISRLGSGAMGSVWRVRDDGGHQYAMKILRDSLAEEDASGERSRDQLTARERLRREAMALQKVRHPGVCGIVDMELDDALAFIVTELIDGKNLREDVRANGRYVGDDLERLGAPGGHLDSVRDLAAAAGVNPNTMQRALAQLENEGLVRTERTAGRYVTEDRALIEQLRAEAARNLTAEFLEKMRGIGYGPEQAAALLERWNEKEGTNHD